MRIDDAFVWEVPEEGFRWVHGESDPPPGDWVPGSPIQRWLVPVSDLRRSLDQRGTRAHEHRRYQPLRDTPGLFLEFAALRQPTGAGLSDSLFEFAVLDFSSRFGALGSEPQDVLVSLRDTQAVSLNARAQAKVRGELFLRWYGAVALVSCAVDLWRATGVRDADAVAELLKDSPEYPQKNLEGGRSALRSLVANGLQLNSNYLSYSDSPSTGKFEISARAGTLLGAIWLQLADALERGLDFRRCDVCSSLFEIAPNARRKDQRYCSTTCRSKALRQRKETALQLHREGRGIEAIADEVGSDERTVARWLGSGR